jgi:hypothetical protein
MSPFFREAVVAHSAVRYRPNMEIREALAGDAEKACNVKGFDGTEIAGRLCKWSSTSFILQTIAQVCLLIAPPLAALARETLHASS